MAYRSQGYWLRSVAVFSGIIPAVSVIVLKAIDICIRSRVHSWIVYHNTKQ